MRSTISYKVTAEQLFARHLDDAVEVSRKYIEKFSTVGSRSYSDDIISEGCKGLWQAATRFNPSKQSLHLKQSFWSVIFCDSIPEKADPYATFWTYAKSRVHGSIRDYLRKEKITVRQYDETDKSIILEDRVVSIDRVVQDNYSDSGSSPMKYQDYFESKDVADVSVRQQVVIDRLKEMVESATLSQFESKIVMLAYRPPGMDVRDIANDLHESLTLIRRTLKTAQMRLIECHMGAAVSG